MGVNRLIAYLGPLGSYTSIAAFTYFRHDLPQPDFRARRTIPAVFESVAGRGADRGVVPSENLIDGTVGQTLDLLVKHNDKVRIVGETIVAIRHCIASPDMLMLIETIYSHPKALAQCADYLASHYPQAELIETSSTSQAMKTVGARGDGSAAAIGHERAAKDYGLHVRDTHIQDNPNNVTSFYVLGKDMLPRQDADRTTISVDIPAERNRPGALFEILSPLKDLDINLSRVESRPTGRMRREYRFFLDMDGSLHEDRIRLVIEWTRQIADVKVLGSYKHAVMEALQE